MTDPITTVSLSAISGAAGVFGGGWFVRFLFQRFFDRANQDHDDLIRAQESIKGLTKDVNAYHEKIRDLKAEIKGLKE